MNVLLTHRPGGAYGHISEAWLNTLVAAGHRAERWDGRFTSWYAFKPDLYIGCSGHRQPIPAGRDRGGCRIAIHVNPYGQVNTGVNEPAEAVKWVVNQRPQLVFGYGFQHQADFWGGWTRDFGIPWCPMPNAGDSTKFKYKDGTRDLDLCYVGGYWPYKARVIDQYLLPLRAHGLQIFGWGNWPGGSSGQPSDDDVPGILARTKVGPCISEPHTHHFGFDLPERVFKVILSGAIAIHDPAHTLESVLPSVPTVNNPEEFINLCRQWSAATELERSTLADKQRREVLNSHTYFHRLARLFHGLGFTPSVGVGLAPFWP